MDRLRIEVVYALPEAATVVAVRLAPGATVADAIEASRIRTRHPEIELLPGRVGIFGRRVPLTRRLRQEDRVEIYRPLIADPRSARRRRAAKPRR